MVKTAENGAEIYREGTLKPRFKKFHLFIFFPKFSYYCRETLKIKIIIIIKKQQRKVKKKYFLR